MHTLEARQALGRPPTHLAQEGEVLGQRHGQEVWEQRQPHTLAGGVHIQDAGLEPLLGAARVKVGGTGGGQCLKASGTESGMHCATLCLIMPESPRHRLSC